ncbi:hypothetical protein AAZX31_06G242900 [Glycine max]
MGHKERKRTNQAVPFGFSIRKGKGIRSCRCKFDPLSWKTPNSRFSHVK